ncbi:hypothetical protein KSF_085470 [Reticulibacter mediterranei]|uniref:Uncharacterized protein n=1 Tax=Reticulibacter mediterranei TaxID=2778369 RepID=A0A8J3N4X4_9CHLR|nr:hypothetical protein KSF_085470 [Reticulibacter mediterranei]
MGAPSIDALPIGFTQPELVNQGIITGQGRFVLDAAIVIGKGIDKPIRSAQCVALQHPSGTSYANIKAIGSTVSKYAAKRVSPDSIRFLKLSR